MTEPIYGPDLPFPCERCGKDSHCPPLCTTCINELLDAPPGCRICGCAIASAELCTMCSVGNAPFFQTQHECF
jgi:hypothetical protein